MLESRQRIVRPTRPVAPYLGGKSKLADRIIERIEGISHTIYAEPFVGMGGVFLRRRLAPESEIINDISRDVANLFRILQRHYIPFMEMMRFQLTTRAEFDRLTATDPDTLTDLERAARFLYLQRTGFGGKVSSRVFGVSPDRPARFDITRLSPLLEEVHSRLARVVIEQLSYDDFIQRYDRPGTLFYLDPPYYDCENDYGEGVFSKADFERLVDLLSNIQGKFLMSLNDVPQVRAIFAAYHIETLSTQYTVSGGVPKQVQEVLISNTITTPRQATLL